MVRIIARIERTKHFIYCIQKGLFDTMSTVLVASNETQKIVNIHVSILERVLQFLMGGDRRNRYTR